MTIPDDQLSTHEAPTVFVLMPFADEFTDVYEQLIKAPFSAAGFTVLRANDIESHQNILKDIVTAINTADLIVADLTDANPNVYYELGLAHALRIPVVLLTQDVEALPFDLRSYRVIEYDTNFANFAESLKRIKALAKDISVGSIAFGSPVTDFLGDLTPSTSHPLKIAEHTDIDSAMVGESDNKPGLIDHIVNVEDGFMGLTTDLEQILKEVEAIGNDVNSFQPQIKTAGQAQNMREAQRILRRLGGQLDLHANIIGTANKRFTAKLESTANSLELMLRGTIIASEADRQSVLDLRATLNNVDIGATEGRDGLVELINAMEAIPRLERHFNKALENLSHHLNAFITNIDNTMAMAARAIAVIDERLDNTGGNQGN